MKQKFIQFLLLSLFVLGSFNFGQAKQELGHGIVLVVDGKAGAPQLHISLPDQYADLVTIFDIPIEICIKDEKGNNIYQTQIRDLNVMLGDIVFTSGTYLIFISIDDFSHKQSLIF